jgi:hypothetical protein
MIQTDLNQYCYDPRESVDEWSIVVYMFPVAQAKKIFRLDIYKIDE